MENIKIESDDLPFDRQNDKIILSKKWYYSLIISFLFSFKFEIGIEMRTL